MKGIYAWLMKLLISKQLKFEEGDIEILGENVLMVPVNFFVQATKNAMRDGKKQIMDLYLAAWRAGFVIVDTFIKNYDLHKYEERYKIAMDVLALAGIGDYRTVEFVGGKFSHFKVLKNPIPLRFYPSKVVVDHFLRGANAGGGTLVHEKIVNCVELKCAAINGKECEFINATTEILKEKIDSKIIKSQLDLNYLIKEEEKIIKGFGRKITRPSSF